MTVTVESLRLFDPGPPDDAPPDASYGVRLTIKRRGLLAAGVHPATRVRVAPEREHTCGECGCAAQVQAGRRWYWKCMKSPLGASHSAASDIRKSWPACVLFVDTADSHA